MRNDHDDLMFRPADHTLDRHPHDRRTGTLAVVLALLIGVPALLWVMRPLPAPPPAAPAAALAPVVSGTSDIEVGETAIRHPVPAVQVSQPTDVWTALRQLLGSRGMAFLQTSDFPRRLVATVDNLGREHASPALWPVVPTPGRFGVVLRGEDTVIARGNAARYAPFVAWVDSLDVGATVGWYRAAYPLFQQAYREQGFGDRYFNDRVVEVIDLLLATPQPQGPVVVRLAEVKGPQRLQRPWVRHEFADPQLQALTAGQKVLVRMGPAHQQRVKKKLAAFRQALATSSAPEAPAVR